MENMFPVLAIAAFFILGIAFFAIGKDDFGIRRIKEVSHDSSTKGNEVVNQEKIPKNESSEKKELVSSDPFLENKSNAEIAN